MLAVFLLVNSLLVGLLIHTIFFARVKTREIDSALLIQALRKMR
jgi:hypothetical protein